MFLVALYAHRPGRGVSIRRQWRVNWPFCVRAFDPLCASLGRRPGHKNHGAVTALSRHGTCEWGSPGPRKAKKNPKKGAQMLQAFGGRLGMSICHQWGGGGGSGGFGPYCGMFCSLWPQGCIGQDTVRLGGSFFKPTGYVCRVLPTARQV